MIVLVHAHKFFFELTIISENGFVYILVSEKEEILVE